MGLNQYGVIPTLTLTRGPQPSLQQLAFSDRSAQGHWVQAARPERPSQAACPLDSTTSLFYQV